METVKGSVTSKGQVVIPVQFRRRLGIREGTQVAFSEENGRLIVQPITADFIRKLRGSLKGEPSALDILMKERKREREL
jgi:AbrB family looped-hinge helix DNA binding protein